jgi:hypothetical protein
MMSYLVEVEIETVENPDGPALPKHWRRLRSMDISYRRVLPAGSRAVCTVLEISVDAPSLGEAGEVAERQLEAFREMGGRRVLRAFVARIRPVDPVRSCAVDPAAPREVSRV